MAPFGSLDMTSYSDMVFCSTSIATVAISCTVSEIC